MNRADRRKLSKATVQDEEFFRAQYRKSVIQKTVKGYSVAVGIVLKDELELPPEKLKAVFARIYNTFECISKGLVSLDELQTQLEDETGVIIE